MKLFSLCWSPVDPAAAAVAGDVSSGGAEGRDGLLWYRDLGRCVDGVEFSMAVIQANQVLEDQSQIESGDFGTFVGIYDGHGGPHAARYVCDHLFRNFHEIASGPQGVTSDGIQRAFLATEEGFIALVSELWNTRPDMATTGTCCLVGIISQRTLYVANSGDSRAVLGRKVGCTGEVAAIQLSTEHNANVEAVRQELKAQHPDDPQIVVLKHGVWRVKGIIQVSRSIGDAYMKHAQYNTEPINMKFRLSEPMSMPILTANPTIISHHLQPSDSFLIFASDGLWEHLSNEKAVEIVHNHPRAGSARRLIKAALQEAARKREMRYSDLKRIDKKVRRHFHDDITVVVLFLNHNITPRAHTQLWYYEISNIKEPARVDESKPPMINWTLEGKKVGSVRTTMILKKSEAAIHILPEQDVARYVHEEIKPSPTTVKAKVEEEVRGKKSLGKKRVQKEDEAYEKLVMLNEAYEQALVARGVDILAIKAEAEKKFAEEKRIRQNKGEPQIEEALSEGDQTREMDIELEEAKVEAEKEEGKGEEGGKEGDQTQAMGSEQELCDVKVAEDVPKKKKGRKRREGGDDTLKVFVSGLRAKSQRTTKKPKFLESPFQTELPKKGRKGKKGVVVVGDDDDKGEKDEGKPLAVSHLDRSTSVAELWKREKSEEGKKLLETLNMGIPSSQDFDVRLPGTINEGFYHNFTVEDIPDVSADENKWLQHFLTLKVDNRLCFEVEGHTICRYDMLHLLRGGRLKDEIIEALVASLRTWLKLPINAHVERKYAIVTSYFSIWLLTASNLDERNVYKNYIKKHIDEGKDVLIIPICHADHWHVLEVNLGQKKCRHYSSADHEAWARDVLTIQLFLDRMVSGFDQASTFRAFQYEAVPCRTQKGSYDCGIHAYFFIKAILEGREVMDIEVLHRESHMLRARLAAQIICEGREWKKLRLKLDSDDPEYLLYFGGSDAPMIEWKY